MEYIISVICAVAALLLGCISCVIADRRIKAASGSPAEKTGGAVPAPTDTQSDSESDCEKSVAEEKSVALKESVSFKGLFSGFGVKQWVLASISAVIVGIASFFIMSYNIDIISVVKMLCCTELLMMAALIDFFTKKIPNVLIIALLLTGAVSLVCDFIFMQDSFWLILQGSLLGFIITFIVLLLASYIAKGGFGMGDVKLISSIGFVTGIACVLYSTVFSLIMCLLVSVVLLFSRKKKMKDLIPFGPFYFIGFVVTVIIGVF